MGLQVNNQVTHSNKTASWNSDAIDTENAIFATLTLDANEDSGTATVDVEIKHSPDNITFYSFATPLTFTQFTATSKQSKDLPDGKFHRYVRVDYTVGGSGQWDMVQSFSARG
jgi:hypothetical protein